MSIISPRRFDGTMAEYLCKVHGGPTLLKCAHATCRYPTKKCEHYRKILKLLALYELLVEYSFVCDEIIGSPNVPSAHSQLCSIYLLVCTSQVTNWCGCAVCLLPLLIIRPLSLIVVIIVIPTNQANNVPSAITSIRLAIQLNSAMLYVATLVRGSNHQAPLVH